ncbi:MAG: DUF4249 family protein [Leeuwenhoekiella sp.]
MKVKTSLYILIFSLVFISCEDVIDVDLPKTEKRLVVDALVRVPAELSDEIVNVSVLLTSTAPFDEEGVPLITGAEVRFITQSASFLFTDAGDGNYITQMPVEILKTETIELVIKYENETYSSTANYVPTVPIDSLEEGDGALFNGDETEVIITYTDLAPRIDYYLFDLDKTYFLASEDKFYQGQQFSFSYFYEDLEPQTVLYVDILGVDKSFYDYMNIVITQSGQDSGGPFESPPATVRGNIINTTNKENYALGYFAIAQEYSATITLE